MSSFYSSDDLCGSIECDETSECDSNTMKCVPYMLTCPGECSGNGVCLYRNRNSGLNIPEPCNVNQNEYCAAYCSCSTNYFGADCSSDFSTMLQKSSIKDSLISSFYRITEVEPPSLFVISNWLDLSTSLIENPEYVSIQSIQYIQNVLLKSNNA